MKYTFILICTVFCFTLNSQQRPGKGGRPGNMPPKVLKGRILDGDSSEGLEFATISVKGMKNNNIVGGGLTGENGTFELNFKGRRISVEIEFISYETIVIDTIEIQKGKQLYDLGEIRLYPSSVTLDDVEIVAEKSESRFSLDKQIFTVGKDLANRGGSAEDVLDNVPSVNVDIDGNVSLRGSEGVRILVDGKPSALVGIGSANGLKNIPSNLIKEVEVITNPSARYEAEGMAGIINIVLKKDKGNGFNGAFDVIVGYPEMAGISANLNYRKGALNWFANYSVNYRTGPGGGFAIQDRTLNTNDVLNRNLTSIDRDIQREGISNSIRMGADYFLSEKEQITGSFLYRISDEENESLITYRDYSDFYADLGFEPLWTTRENENFLSLQDLESMVNEASWYGDTRRSDDELEDESSLQYSLNYRKEYSSRNHYLNAIVQYRDKAETESNKFFEQFENLLTPDNFELDQRANNSEKESTWLLQLDYVKTISKEQKWEIGARSSLRTIDTDYLVQESIDGGALMTIDGLENDFLYTEDIHAIYGIYGNRINKISYQLGLRPEYTDINTQLLSSGENQDNPRSYFNIFPSGHLSYHLSETHAFQLSYSQRVGRPRFWDLNPFFTFQDRRNFFSGNPNLNPEFTDSYEIGQINYWDKLTLNTSLFYRRTEDSRQRAFTADKNEVFTLRVPINIGIVNDYGFDFSANYNGFDWLRLNFNTNIFRNQLSLNEDEALNEIFNFYKSVRGYTQDLEAFQDQFSFEVNETDNITWNAKLMAQMTFWESDFQVRLNYRGPRQTAQGNNRGILSVNLGWSKDFLPNKNLSLTLSVRDLFNSRRRAGIQYLDDFYNQSEFQWRQRTTTLTASYRINQKRKKGNSRNREDFEGGEF